MNNMIFLLGVVVSCYTMWDTYPISTRPTIPELVLGSFAGNLMVSTLFSLEPLPFYSFIPLFTPIKSPFLLVQSSF